MMYARVLYVGAMPLGEADEGYRVCEALRRAGHAVLLCNALAEDDDPAGELASMCRAFGPTLAVWDVESTAVDPACAQVLADCGCCVAVLVDAAAYVADAARATRLGAALEALPGAFVLARAESQDMTRCLAAGLPGRDVVWLSCLPDERYVDALASTGETRGPNFACTQECTAARRAAAAHAEERLGLSALAPRGSWPYGLWRRFPGERAAYHLRTACYAVYFADEETPALSDVAMRMAEGALVLMDDRLPARMAGGALMESVFTFIGEPAQDVPDSLVEVLGDLERAPVQREMIREAQRQALLGAPSLEESLTQALGRLDRLQRAAAGTPVLAMDQPARRVVVFGWQGAGNYGDDLLLRVATQRISARYPQAYFCVMGADCAAIRHDMGYEAFDPRGGSQIRDALRGASLLVSLGGLVFDEPASRTAGTCEFMLGPWIIPQFQADLALSAWLEGVPMVGLGIGGGPAALPATKDSLRLMAKAGMLFLSRDEHTARLFRAAGVPDEQIRVRADLVLGARECAERGAAPTLPAGLERAGYFVVSLRDCPSAPPDFSRRVACLVAALLERCRPADGDACLAGPRAVLVPFDGADVEIHARVAESLGSLGYADDVTLLDERPEESAMLALVGGSRFALAMRLHCGILHHVMGKPALGLNYNDKVEAYFERMGQGDVLLPLDFTDDQADAALTAFLDDLPARALRVGERVGEAAALVDQAFEEAFALMEGAPAARDDREVFYPRTTSAAEQQLELERRRAGELDESLRALRRRCADVEDLRSGLQTELETERVRAVALEREVDELRASHSYRLGNAFMRIPAWIRRKLRG